MNKKYIFPSKELLNEKIINGENDRYYPLSKILLKKELNDKLIIPIGVIEKNEKYYLDLKDMSGMFICGETGSGKSVFIDSIITTLLLKNDKEELKFLFIDPNMVELNEYNGIPHLLKDTISDPIISLEELNNILNIINYRRDEFVREKVTNIAAYNNLSSEKMPHIIVVIDESSDIMRINKSIDILKKILDDGYRFGIHLILATSSYLKKDFSKEFLDLFTYVLSFDLSSNDQAEFINLRNSNWLKVSGEAIIKEAGFITKIQTPYVSTEEIKRVVSFIIKNNKVINKMDIFDSRDGFIAALDQSGGSSKKTLELYGVDEDRYIDDEEMFDLIHEFRKRIITSKIFNKEKILGVIIFEDTMNRKINNKYVADYLLEDKEILTFLKIDKGLDERKNGVQLMKPILNLEELLGTSKKRNVFGTKMRSVIYENIELGIEEIVMQQFSLAKTIYRYGLIPIIEPEVDINAKDKCEIEKTLKEKIDKELDLLEDDVKVIFKFSIPTIPNFYSDYINHKNVLKVVFLSGGYDRCTSCKLLKENKGVVASFSRALLQDLKENQSDMEFDKQLNNNIEEIFDASVKKIM